MFLQSARQDQTGAASRNRIARWTFANATAGRGVAILCISIVCFVSGLTRELTNPTLRLVNSRVN